MMRRWSLILSLIILCNFTACKENRPDTPEDHAALKAITTPENSRRYEGLPLTLTNALLSLKLPQDPSELKVIGGIPEAKIKTFNVAAYVEYADGWLVASGYGEWGGVIFWIDKNGGYEIIRDDNLAYPIDVMARGSTILISQGMNHLVLDRGHLLEVNRNNGSFETRIYPINTYPNKFEKHEGEWIIPVDSNQKYFLVSELRSGRTVMHERN